MGPVLTPPELQQDVMDAPPRLDIDRLDVELLKLRATLDALVSDGETRRCTYTVYQNVDGAFRKEENPSIVGALETRKRGP
jgi:hypothetical protein